MEVRAVTKFSGISAQKTRLVLDQMRGRKAEDAMSLLGYMPQSAAKVVAKTRVLWQMLLKILALTLVICT